MARKERKEVDTDQESLAELTIQLPLACGMWKAISEITGFSVLALASHKRHCGIIKAGCRAKKKSY